VLINASIRQLYLCCMLLSANDYTFHQQDTTTTEHAIMQFY